MTHHVSRCVSSCLTGSAVLLLASLALAEDIGRGGTKKTIPAGVDGIVIDFKNKVTSFGTVQSIVDFDIAICTASSPRMLSGGAVDGVTEPTDDSAVDDDNDESLGADETDDVQSPAGKKMRLQIKGSGGSDGIIDPNHEFRLRIRLDAPTNEEIQVQITPTDALGDAWVSSGVITGSETVILLPSGSNDANLELVNQTGTTLDHLVLGAALPATVDVAKTSSETFPWGYAAGGWVVVADGSVPPGGVLLARIQLQQSAQPEQPFVLRILAGGPMQGNYCGCASGPCANDDPQAGCRSSTGAGAHLSALGTSEIFEDALVLRMQPLPSNQFGLLFMGTNSTSLPFGDGYRCVSGNLFRFPVQNSGAAGEIALGPIAGYSKSHFPPQGHILAGSLWYFQGWFRDPQGPCGSGWNLSDAARVQFVP